LPFLYGVISHVTQLGIFLLWSYIRHNFLFICTSR